MTDTPPPPLGHSIVAAAGCGKTESIVAAVKAGARERDLVLTHTNAGVEVLRRRLRQRGVAASAAAVETIDSFALRYVSAYPRLAGYQPETNGAQTHWPTIHEAALRLLDTDIARRVVRASYSGLFVDEYQDCQVSQHRIVVALARDLPTVIYGDPLQTVFRFGSNVIVNWKTDVYPVFPVHEQLTTPHRWDRAGANQALGTELTSLRASLRKGIPHDTSGSAIGWRHEGKDKFAAAVEACFELASANESVAAICKWPRDAQLIAKRTGGRFQAVEALEAKDAFAKLEELANAPAERRIPLVLDLVAMCCTGGDVIKSLRADVPHEPALLSVRRVLTSAVAATGWPAIAEAIDVIRRLPSIRVFRGDLLWSVIDALRASPRGEREELLAAMRSRRQLTGRIGRRVGRFSAGTVLLVKGLEFDHAIVLPHEMSRNELYVALTRGCRSVRVISDSPILRPFS